MTRDQMPRSEVAAWVLATLFGGTVLTAIVGAAVIARWLA